MCKAHHQVDSLEVLSSTPTLHLNKIFASGAEHKIAATVAEAFGVKVELTVAIGLVFYFQTCFSCASHMEAVGAFFVPPGSTTFLTAANLHSAIIATESTLGTSLYVFSSVAHYDG
jgi:hypothetical protein